MFCLGTRFVKFSARFPLHNLDSKAALSITTIWPPQLMLFWLLSSSRKDKMAAGFEIEYCMIGPSSCMLVRVDCCMLGRKGCFCPYNRCPGAVKSYYIRKVWFKTLKLSFFKKKIYTVGTR